MTHKELLVVAQELGIENAESLAYNDLQKAVSKAKKEKAQEGKAVLEEIDPNTSDLSSKKEGEIPNIEISKSLGNSISKVGSEASNINGLQEGLPSANESIGVEQSDIQEGDTSQSLDITEALNTEKALDGPVTFYEDDSGRKYCFSEFTPDKFRFNDQVKTKEEWLKDKDAMEQLVFGNCTYVQQIFNN